MDLNIFASETQMTPPDSQIDAQSLYRAFEQVKDGRKARGKRYPLALLLTLIMLGKLAGEKTISGIRDWIAEREQEIKARLNWPKRFPVQSTYAEALAQCSAEEIVQAIAQVLLKARAMETCGTEPSRLVHQATEEKALLHTALDGKPLRGTLGHAKPGQPPVHLVALYECESGIVLTQRVVASKENEISAAGALLHPWLVKGRIISADAMHTQKKWCAGVHGYGGYYLLIAKENQPGLRQDLLDFFSAPELDGGEWEYHKQVQKGHGRLEQREIWTSTQMNAWFENDWAGIAQIFRVRRTVRQGETVREEQVYGLTNLPRSKAHAPSLLRLNQQHWRVENRLHYRRDVTLGEDACQVRLHGAPQALLALNGGVLAFMDWLGVNNVAKYMRHLCAHPQEALHLLLGRLSR